MIDCIQNCVSQHLLGGNFVGLPIVFKDSAIHLDTGNVSTASAIGFCDGAENILPIDKNGGRGKETIVCRNLSSSNFLLPVAQLISSQFQSRPQNFYDFIQNRICANTAVAEKSKSDHLFGITSKGIDI